MDIQRSKEIKRQILLLVKDKKMDKELAFDLLKDVTELEQMEDKDIAIIGLSMKFPGADTLEQYWDILYQGENKIGSFPESRYKDIVSLLGKSLKKDKITYFNGGFLNEIDKFDAEFFRISPREAEMMEPNQRLFLETAYLAFEDAGYGGDSLRGSKTGVFVGTDHTHRARTAYLNMVQQQDFTAITGSWTGILASRVSYCMDLIGPSMVIDTGCSSSAVAIHTACKSLFNKECNMAVAGGINLLLSPVKGSTMVGDVETDSTVVRPFDNRAEGTIWGEGVGAVILKPLREAVKDGDNIYAVIKGGAVNNNGLSNAITSINANVHKDLILSAWKSANVRAEDIDYIEAHGMGTIVGDAIEVNGMNNAFHEFTNVPHLCGIGSLKGNLGHLVACASMASLFKIILALNKEVLPQTINFKEPNKGINFDNSSVYVVDHQTPWKRRNDKKRIAGINCFSFSGTNCHLVIEEAPKQKNEMETSAVNYIFTVSARTKNALKKLIHAYHLNLADDAQALLGDFSYTSTMGRGHYRYRIAIVADSITVLQEKVALIEKELEKDKIEGIEDVFYGEHYVITAAKKNRGENEITEEERRKLTRAIELKINKEEGQQSKNELLKDVCLSYVKGADINWEFLYEGQKRKRAKLSVYPLEKTRYWVKIKQDEESGSAKNIILEIKKYEKELLSEAKKKAELLTEEQVIKCRENENVFDTIEDYGRVLLLKAFQRMGIFLDTGECYDQEELIHDLGIIDMYHKFFLALLNVLEKGGFVKYEKEKVVTCDKINDQKVKKYLQNIDKYQQDLSEKYSEVESYFKLLRVCLDGYDKILTGAETAVSIMFPNYSMELVGNIYQGNGGVDYFNTIVGKIARYYILNNRKGTEGNRKIRILEIGAGTGGTSAFVFPEVAEFADNIEYCYTDISYGFVDYGKKTFYEQYPFLTFQLLNIEKRIEQQGFEQNSYDIVIAANVIHGTKNLKNTINQIKKLLRKNGILVLNEVTRVQDFTTLTFGLMPGWWSFEDDSLRMKYSPLLNSQRWKRVLEEEGFSSLASFNDYSSEENAEEKSVLSVIMGESDGNYVVDGDEEDDKAVIPERVEFDTEQRIEVTLEGKEDGEYTEAERDIAQIWREALGFTTINIYSDFFELGGDSIIAMRIVSIIGAGTGKKINMMEVLNRPTVSEFAEYLEAVLQDDTSDETLFRKIEKTEKSDYYAVSAAQKRIYIISHFEGKNINYNVPTVFFIEGDLNREKMTKAFHELVARHEAFRTSFELKDGEVVQKISPEAQLMVEWVMTEEEQLQKKIKESVLPFELEKAPLTRVKIFEVSPQKHYIFIDMHHIVCDGTSIAVVVRELLMFLTEQEDKLKPIGIEYKDFAVWQNKLLKTDYLVKQKQYWLDQFSDDIPVLNLPLDYRRPEVQSLKGSSLKFSLSQECTGKLKDMVKKTDSTSYMILLAIYNILLAKYSGQDDIVVGSVIAGRNHPELFEVVGMFVNTLAMKNHPSSNKTFMEFMSEVKETALNAYKNQDFQFEELVEDLKLTRSANRNPLFDVVFSMQNMSVPYTEKNDLRIAQYNNQSSTSKYDLTLFAEEAENQIQFLLEYCTSLFREDSIIRLSEHFTYIVEQVLENPQILLKDIQLIGKEEMEEILESHSIGEKIELNPQHTVLSLIEKQAARVPDKDAIIFNQKHLTYRQFDERANQIANFLQTVGARKNRFVGVMIPNSIEQTVAILGVLKSGAAFIPIDPNIPYERVKAIVDGGEIEIILSVGKYIYELNKLEWESKWLKHFVCIDEEQVYDLSEEKQNKLMKNELWEYVGERSVDEITGGGWNNSYTAEPFSKKEMEEYGENAKMKLLPYLSSETKVLEIGCASGLTMFRVAPYVKKYVGTDLSNMIQQKNKQKIEDENLENIELKVLAAHEIDQIKDEKFHIVVINSVIQCFHGHNYLRKVLIKALNLLEDEGIIFLGDLMDQDKKQELIESTIKFANETDSAYATKADWSEELFISKGYLEDRVADIPEFQEVAFSDKIGTIENELTKYRFDAVITVNKNKNGSSKKEKSKFQHGWNDVARFPVQRMEKTENADDYAYSIFTSGTSGRPKGVVVGHHALLNLCTWHNLYYQVSENDRATRYAAPGFDASIWELFPYLVAGASIYIIDESIRLNVRKLADYFESNKISIAFLPTQMCQLFMEYENHSLRALLTGGDKLTRFIPRTYSLYNNYGPTEYTVVTTSYLVKDTCDNIPIGTPIANTCVYVLDQENHIQPYGIPGELCIAGKGISKGYLNNPQLTEEKFTVNPFGEGNMYQTGDLVKMNTSGNIEYLGRLDEQVKIRGFRIELGEIESILRNMDTISEAVAVVKEHLADEKIIYAYYVSENELDENELKRKISQLLPEYMVPNYFIKLDRIPLTVNGKLNKKKLPDIQMEEGRLIEKPETQLQKDVCELFCEILDIQEVGIQEDFFQIGGYSLKATQLMTEIQDKFNVDIPLGYIFKNATVRGIAEYIESNSKNTDRNENLVCLAKGTNHDKNLFFVHAGEGGIEPYVLLSDGIEDEWNCWGIQCDVNTGTSYEEIIFEDLALKYLELIRIVQPEGPYYIGGWCQGGVLAYEITSQLELQGEPVKVLAMLDSREPEKNVEQQKQLARISESYAIENTSKDEWWDEWQERLKDVEPATLEKSLPEVFLRSLPNREAFDSVTLFKYVNRLILMERAQLAYQPKGKIKTTIQYYVVDDDIVQNEKEWEKYSERVNFEKVTGDHYSMLQEGNVEKLVDSLNKLLTV